MKDLLCALLFFCLNTHCLHSQTMDDNVIVNDCEDSYIFKDTSPGAIVHHTRKTVYEALRMGATIQPYTLYGEFISLNEAKVNGIIAPKAIHRNATPENMFFDDTRICYFNLGLSRQGKKATVEFARTFHDLHYFTQIYFPEEFFIRRKRVTITIPASLSHFRLIERNFTSGIRCERGVNKAGDSLFTYTLNEYPAIKRETNAPTNCYLYPHLLITGSFADTQQMYSWLNGLANVDCTLPQSETIVEEITGGCTTELEKIRRTYAYVQQNIRYIAYESGIAGHQPDRPAEVLRKRYGDCKGMSLLLRTLLKMQGFDARMAYIGTDDIACQPDEVPTLATINHAVCLLFYQGKKYCLDATHRYLPLEAVPQEIQGRNALVENGEHCLIQTLPCTSAATDSLTYHYNLLTTDHGNYILEGSATRTCTDENKESLLSFYHNTAKGEQKDFLGTLLANKQYYCTATDIRLEEGRPESRYLIVTSKVSNGTAVQNVDGTLYIEPDPHNDFYSQPVDTTHRRLDYLLPWKCRIVREVTIDIPQGRTVSYLPPEFQISIPQGVLSCSYRTEASRILFRKVMEIRQRHIPVAMIPAWNDALRQWKKACEEQIVIL